MKTNEILPLLMALLGFGLLLPWGDWLVRQLLRRGIGKTIRFDGPSAHQGKSGTATMGGLYFITGVTVLVVLLALLGHWQALVPWLAMIAFGTLGAFDDLQGLGDSKGVGWLARGKFLWQWALALTVSIVAYLVAPEHPTVVPGRDSFEIGRWFVPLGAVLLVASANAVNLTDGLDGLAGGLATIAFVCFGVLTIASRQLGLAGFSFAVAGCLLAFLWLNVHPARLFMGDVGSQALGAGLAAVAMLSGYWLLLPVIGLVFVVEVLSDVIQVAYFKYTRRKYGEGRRVFRMAPLHHHFELSGCPEVQITARFWIIGLICGAAGLVLGFV